MKNNKKSQIKSFDFFNKKDNVEEYTRMYGDINFSVEYPANLQRANIICSILDEIKPEKLIDAGCGTGMPLIQILKMDIDAIGYDKSDNMVKQAKENLEKYGHDPSKVSIGNFEDPIHTFFVVKYPET